jgi:hypothetical protein
MRKTIPGRRHRGAGLLTRAELVARLGVSPATVDRLIGEDGLQERGILPGRGGAKVYSVAEARALLRREKPGVPVDLQLRDFYSSARDFADRRRVLLETQVADEAWLPAWRRYCAAFAERTSTFPAGVAEVADSLTWARGIAVDSDYVPEVLGYTPLRHRDEPPAPSPTPLVRPFLEDAAAWTEQSEELKAVFAALDVPPSEPEHPQPSTVEDARDLWRRERTAWRDARLTAKRGHRKRAVVEALILAELTAWRQEIWSWRGVVGEYAGDGDAARRSCAETLDRAHARLLTLDGAAA